MVVGLFDVILGLFYLYARTFLLTLMHTTQVCAPYDVAELTRQQVCVGFCSVLTEPPIHFTNIDFEAFTTLDRPSG